MSTFPGRGMSEIISSWFTLPKCLAEGHSHIKFYSFLRKAAHIHARVLFSLFFLCALKENMYRHGQLWEGHFVPWALKSHHMSPAVCPLTYINEDTNLPSPMKVLLLTWHPKIQLLSNFQTKYLHSRKPPFEKCIDLNKIKKKNPFSLVWSKTCYHIRN